MATLATYVLDDRNQDATVYVGNLDEKVTETILWELFLQGGPVVSVHLPKDRVTYIHQGFGFVEFVCEEDADYCIKIMNMIKLFGKPIRVNKASTQQKNLDIGANLFIGNLDTEVDEKLLYDTFSAFGPILQTPKIMRDYEIGAAKGYAFINYANFDAADSAIDAMNGQFLCNRPITVSYAYKKDAKGERHGSAAERLLAKQNPLTQHDRPHQRFADIPPTTQNPTRVPFQPPPPQFNPSMSFIPPPPIRMEMAQNMPPMYPVPPPMGHMPPPPNMIPSQMPAYPFPPRHDMRMSYPTDMRMQHPSDMRMPYPPDMRMPYPPDMRMQHPPDMRMPYPPDMRMPYPPQPGYPHPPR